MARCTRPLTGLTIACLAASLLTIPAPVAAAPADGGFRNAGRARRWTTGRVVVRWKASAPAAARRRAAAETGGSSPARLRGDVEVLQAGDPAVTAARLTRRADVVWAEPELLRYASADEATPERATMHTGAAWAADDRMLGDGVEIAVIDQGVAADNPDLNGAGKVVDGGDCSSGTCAGTGGISVDPDSEATHGTAVAAVAAAELDNAGIAGSAPGATIVAYRVFPFGDATASSTAIVSALEAAAARPAVKVINLSLGSPFVSELERDTIAGIRADRPDITIVAAAGNDGRDLPEYPAGYDGVLSVGATGPAEGGKWEPAGFSNTGDVDVLAPGVSVRSWNGNTLTNWDGTSFAAPAVSGILAGLAATGVTGDRARGVLLASAGAPHLGTAPPVAGGNGRADAKAALDLATGSSAWTALALTRGNYLANVVGWRTVEQLRFEPGAGPAGGAVPVSATIGGVDAIQDEDQTAVSAGTQGSGGLRPPAGTLTTATTTLRAPATDVGVADGSLTATGGGVTRPFPYRTTLAGSGPDGIPVEHGRLYTASLAYGVASADIHMVTLEQGHQLSLGLATPPDVGIDETAVLDIWEPDTVGGTADPREPPSNAGGWYNEGTVEYTAPRDGRYAIGYVLLDPAGAGRYKLRVTCTSCPNPISDVTAQPSPFSPNGDGVKETATVTTSTTRSGPLTVEVRTDSGALVRTLFSGTRAAGTLTTTWNGNTGLGKPAGSGRYRVTVRAATADGDLWTGLAPVELDRVRPTPLYMARSAATVYPYRDGYLDTIELRSAPRETTTGGRVDVFNARGQRVWATTIRGAARASAVAVRWNGRTSAGRSLPDGRYSWSVTMTDRSGLTGTSTRQGFALTNRRVR